MSKKKTCDECGSQSFVMNPNNGATECASCGLEKNDNAYDNSLPRELNTDHINQPAPRSRIPMPINFNQEIQEGDRIWTIPPPKKGRITNKQKIIDKIKEIEKEIKILEKESSNGGDSKDRLQKIDQLYDEGRKLANFGRDNVWDEDPNKNISDWKKNLSEWRLNDQTKRFFNLYSGVSEAEINKKIKELDPNLKWLPELEGKIITKQGFIRSALCHSHLPPRSPIDEQTKKRIETPHHERLGLEIYCLLSERDRGFWFFSDFIKRFRLNPKDINKILSQGLPLSIQIIHPVENINIITEHKRCFVDRCARIVGYPDDELPDLHFWFEYPDELMNKLKLRVKGEDLEVKLHYWIPLDSPSQKERGIVRPHRCGLKLLHIPLAYFTAQEIWCRRGDGFRDSCVKILKLIEEDLEWCSATVVEMDSWWDKLWESNRIHHGDKSLSVTKLRHK